MNFDVYKKMPIEVEPGSMEQYWYVGQFDAADEEAALDAAKQQLFGVDEGDMFMVYKAGYGKRMRATLSIGWSEVVEES